MTKKKLWILLFFIGFCLGAANVVNNIIIMKHRENQCGKIVRIYSQPHKVKENTYYDQYFLVNFDKTGMESINVDMTTFMSHKEGQRVCFMLNEEQMHVPGSQQRAGITMLCLFTTLVFMIITIGLVISSYIK